MNAFMKSVKRASVSITTILFFAAALFTLLLYVGNFGTDFLPVLGNLFSMLIRIGIWLIVPVLLLARKRVLAKWALIGVVLYWVISFVFTLLTDTGFAVANATALAISVGVFSFLAACALIAMVSFLGIAAYKKDRKTKFITLLIYCGTLVFLIVLFSLTVALNAKWGVADWNDYFGIICDDLIVPFAMLFAAIAFGFKREEFVCSERVKPAKVKKTASQEVEPKAAPSDEVQEFLSTEVHEQMDLFADPAEESPAQAGTSEEKSAEESTLEEKEALAEEIAEAPESEK